MNYSEESLKIKIVDAYKLGFWFGLGMAISVGMYISFLLFFVKVVLS